MDAEKPTSLGAVMKLLARTLPQPWTKDQMRAALDANPDYARLLAMASASLFGENLKYWTSHGKLQKDGDAYRNLGF